MFCAAYYAHRNLPLASVEAGRSVALWVPKKMWPGVQVALHEGPVRVATAVVGTLCEGILYFYSWNYIQYSWKNSLWFIYPGVSLSSSALAALCLFAKAGIAVAGSNVSLLLLPLQSCTDEREEVPEFVLRLL